MRERAVEHALLEVGFQQQQGGGDFERERVRMLQGVTTQPLGKRLQSLEQVQGGGAAECGCHRHEGAEALVEVRERDCRAGAEGVPLLAHTAECLLQVLQQGAERDVADGRVGGGQESVELPAIAHGLLLCAASRQHGDAVEDVAQETVERRLRAGEQATKLGINLCT